MIIKKDKYLYAIDLPVGTVIKFGSTTIPLSAGRYYAHRDGTLASTHPGIYQMIINHMQTAFLGRTFDFTTITLAGYALKTGIRLTQTGGAAIGSLDLNGTSPVIRKVLGFSETDTGTYAWSSGSIEGPFAAWGQWVPWSLFEGRATIKDSFLDRDVEWSSPHPEVATAIVWRERRVRTLKYDYVFGTYINPSKTRYSALVAHAGLALGDTHNALENLWSVAGRHNTDMIVIYDLEDIDLYVTSHEYEIVRFSDKRQTMSMDSIATRVSAAHDFWTVTLGLIVRGGSYGL